MTYQSEIAREFIRDAFMCGALDLSGDDKMLKGFISIFAGEMEAIIALTQADHLSDDERSAMLELADPNPDSVTAFQTWRERAL